MKTKQLNMRLPSEVRSTIDEFASRFNLSRSAVVTTILEEAVKNRCKRCVRGLSKSSKKLDPKPCRFCYGTGRKDVAKQIRKMEKRAKKK